MHKILSFLLVSCLIVSLAACGGNAAVSSQEQFSSDGAVLLTSTIESDSSAFSDISADAIYADAVAWCKEAGIMNGTSDTAFSPNSTLTRAMLATVLFRAAGNHAVEQAPAFPDVPSSSVYASGIAWAAANGIVSGYTNGRFGLHDPVSRQQLAAILWRYDGEKDAEMLSFPDSSLISDYARTAANWAISQNVLTTRAGGGFAPLEAATRAEVAMALYTYLRSQPNAPSSGTVSPESKPTVYMTADISSDGLMAIYKALEANPEE